MKKPTRIVLALTLLAGMAGWSSCANMIPPAGGPRDSLPPVLVLTQPKDSALNVPPTVRELHLVFDEYVSLDNAFSNLIVSPSLKYSPNVTSRLHDVTIRLRDTLDPNTTYLFDFGDAIKDVNEGNVARGLRYVISTGNKLDSNQYRGKVIMAETGRPDSTVYAMLYRNPGDSAVYKEAPRYYTRVNGRGEFAFRNLPDGDFAVYVLDKKAVMKTYTDSSFIFGFLNHPVHISSQTLHDTVYVYQAYKRDQQNAARPSASPSNPAIKAPGNKDDKRLRYSIELDNGRQDVLSDLKLAFQRKIFQFDSNKIVLYDTFYHRIEGHSVTLDSTKTRVAVKYNWPMNTPYRLIVAKDAVADSLGTSLTKSDTLLFYTKKEAEYGSIRIRFPTIDLSRNPVLQFVQNDKIIESFPLTGKDLIRKLYKPGTYDVRILYDTNKNGVWDAGQFLPNKRQPEIVQLLPKQLVIRANWDNDVTY